MCVSVCDCAVVCECVSLCDLFVRVCESVLVYVSLSEFMLVCENV